MGKINILSIDGGGSKGIVSAVLIDALETATKGFLKDIDMIAGTSIGAANASALAVGNSPESMVKFYMDSGCNIFGKRYQPDGFFGLILRVLCSVPILNKLIYKIENLFMTKWDNQGLEQALETYFGKNTTLADAEKKLLLTAMQLDGTLSLSKDSVVLPVTMTNFADDGCGDLTLHEAVLRSMSAPTFFQSHSGFVDGGMFAANPCVAALAAAINTRRDSVLLSDINMISIGTGISNCGIKSATPVRWGLLQWGKKAISASEVAVIEFDALQCAKILGANFYRLNITLPHQFALDDCRQLAELKQVATEAITGPEFKNAVDFIVKHIKRQPLQS